jgi:outer membrane autotransporter protein
VAVEDRASSADIATYQAAIYGGTVEGPLMLRGGLAYGASEVSTQRNVSIGQGFVGAINEFNEAQYGASTAQAFGEVGYRLEVGSATFEPFAGLTYVNASTDGFSESGALTGLTAEAQGVEQTYASLGIRAKGEFELGEMTAALHGSLAWRHAFGDDVPTATLALEGEEFTVAGVPAGADAALVEAGFDLGLTEGATLGVSYSGVITETSADQSVKGVLSVKF